MLPPYYCTYTTKSEAPMKLFRNFSLQQAWRIFLGTALQCVTFGFAALCIRYGIALYPQDAGKLSGTFMGFVFTILIVLYYLFPLFCAFGYCFLRNGRSFHRGTQKATPMPSGFRFAVRLLSVSCFLLIALYVCLNVGASGESGLQLFLNDFLFNSGVLGETLYDNISNLFFYLYIAIFPLAYALAEYSFVPVKEQTK